MNKYIKAIFTNYLYFILSSLLFLIITPIAVNTMGDIFFGLWSILNAVIGFSSIGNLGMGVVINKFAAESEIDRDKTHRIISSGIAILLPMAAVAFIVLILIRGWIIPRLDIDSVMQKEFSIAVFIAAFSLFPTYINRIWVGYLLSQLKNQITEGVELAARIALWAGVILITIFQKNLILIATWMLIVQSVKTITLFLFVFKLTGFKFIIDRAVIKRMTNFSFFTFVESLAVMINQTLDRIIVGITLGPAAAGAYSVGTSISLRLSIITGQVTNVMIPYASKEYTAGHKETLLKNYRNMTRAISVLLMVAAGLLTIWMHEILSLWISPEYAVRYGNPFSLLVLAFSVLSLSRTGQQTLTGLGKVKFSSSIYLLMSLLTIAGIYLFSSPLGFMGVSLARMSAVVLISYNIAAPIFLSQSFSLKEFLADNIFAVAGPLCGVLIIGWGATSLTKALYSLIILGGAGLWAFRDEFMKSLLKNFYSRFRETLSQ